MPGVFGEKVQAGHIQSELATFGEFANEGACAEYLFLGDVGGQDHQGVINVEHFVFNKPENSRRLVINQILESLPDVFEQLREQDLGLLVCQWSHINNGFIIIIFITNFLSSSFFFSLIFFRTGEIGAGSVACIYKRKSNIFILILMLGKLRVQYIFTNGLNASYYQPQVPKNIKPAPAAKVQKANTKTVKIDIPLPTGVKGIENRLNSKNTFEVPKVFSTKHKPEHVIGQNVRLSYLVEHYQEYIDKIVTVTGWARQTRLAAKDTLLFVKLIDGSNTEPLQVVIESTIPNWEQVKKAKIAYSFKLTGKILKSEGKGQTIELKLKGEQFEKVLIYGKCDDDKYPLSGKQINLETLRDIAHLRPRTQIMGAVARIKNNLAYATHQFFQNNGFLYVHTPLITAADCEGAGEMFEVTTIIPESGLVKDIPQVEGKIDFSREFFKKRTSLTVSGQLAVENFCCALSNVYTFGPTFRAEVSHTSRHMAEFWMIEPELAFADVFDTMECAEAYVQFCIKFILENNKEDLAFVEKKKPGHIEYLKSLVEGPFAKASYTEAIEILQEVVKKGHSFPKDEKEDKNKIEWGIDLASEHERYLCEHIFHRPVILYNYPKHIKAFYMRDNEDGKTVAAFDILAPEVGEIVGGSQRQQRLEVLEGKIDKLGLPKQNYWWYLDLRRYGTVPHGGFGLGFERLVMMVAGIENIRDVACFPRTPGKAEF